MAIDRWIRPVYSGQLPKPGTYIGRITNYQDPTYMGNLEVAIERGNPNSSEIEGQTYPVVYVSPFYGITGLQFEGNNPGNYDDVQKSYGFWMVPPDIGTRVLVMFVEGHPFGYWIGCLPDQFQNHMIPGIAATQDVYLTPEQASQYGTKNLPAAEFLKKTIKPNLSPNRQRKPVHPFADRLLAQGLLIDNIRGVTSSSARRELPSGVFGISTPGPIDKNGPKGLVGQENKVRIPVSRLGGSQFVMDDGDLNGQNELVRIRTRTGHQILLHNSSDLIYIANAAGTAWFEMTGSGKIDIYAADSISIHSEADFNFRADRDINIEASRNINVKSYGKTHIESRNDLQILVLGDGQLSVQGQYDQVVNEKFYLSVTQDMHVISGGSAFISGEDGIDMLSEGSIKQSTGGNFEFGAAGNLIASATEIHLNGPAAEAASSAETAKVVSPLPTFALPYRSVSAGWANGNFYQAGSITSIMQRVPTHEPWDQHENINLAKYSAEATDVEISDTSNPRIDSRGDTIPNSSPPPTLSKNAKTNEQYLQKVLVDNGIINPIKLAAWMAQCKVESAGFRALREFASGAEYEGRKDLGNTEPGDGVRFKGRGFIQLTGRDVYTKMTKYFNAGIDFEENPELVEELEWASKSVLYFFNAFKPKGFKNRTMIQPYRDTEIFWDDVLSVSALVNGGRNGLEQRKQYYADYKTRFLSNGVKPDETNVA